MIPPDAGTGRYAPSLHVLLKPGLVRSFRASLSEKGYYPFPVALRSSAGSTDKRRVLMLVFFGP